MVVALVASTTGLTANVTTQIAKMGVTTINVMPGGRIRTTDEDVAALAGLDGVKEVIPYYNRRLQINYGSTTISISVYGLDHNRLFSLYQGLGLDRGDLADMYDPTGVVIGSSIAKPPEGDLPTVDVSELLILETTGGTRSTYSFLVRGVLRPFGAVGYTNIDETAFMTLIGSQLMFKLSSYSGLYVIANSPEDVLAVTTSVQEYFGANARIMSASAMLETVQSVTNQMAFFMGGIAAVSLFVAGVGIANTMFVSVMERTREIGVMKAIGYRPRNILVLFLAEASMTGIIGGFLGTITGAVLSFLLSGGLPSFRVGVPMAGRPMGASAASSAGFMPVISPGLVLFSLVFPIAISILAGLYPAWRASRLNTVTALKHE